MSALILCSIIIASSQVFAIQLQQMLIHPPAQSPISSSLPVTNYQPRLDLPDIQTLPGIYNYKTEGFKTNSHCQNSETLQNILSVLQVLLNQDDGYFTNANFGKLNEKLQILAWLRNYLENSEQQDKTSSPEEQSHFNVVSNTENPKTHVEAKFTFKYEIPRDLGRKPTDLECQEALMTLIQTINNAQDQLMNYCRLTENCILQEPVTNINFNKLPNTPLDILSSIPTMLSRAQIRGKFTSDDNFRSSNDKRQLLDNYLEPTRYDSQANVNSEIIPLPTVDYKSINRKGSNYETLSNFPDLIRLLTKESKSQDDNINVARHNHLPHELHARERNNPSSLFSDHLQSNILLNNYKLNRPSNFDLDNIHESISDRYSSSSASFGTKENIYNDRPSNIIRSFNKPSFTSLKHRFQNRNPILHSNAKATSNIGRESVYSILNQNSGFPPAIKILNQNSGLPPAMGRAKSWLAQKYSLMANNLQYNLQNKLVNQNRIPGSYVNPYTPFYSADYLKQGVYGSKLFDSPQLTSVPNLGKLNFADDNNGIVELTYTLTRPETYKPYYYVKYQLSYNAFVSKILELARNPEFRRNPARLNEEFLAVSNVADASPDLRTVENSELSKLVLRSGALVNASVLGGRRSKTDELLRTVQDLNSKLNTNELLNLAGVESKTTGKLRDGSSDFSNYGLSDANSLTSNDLESENLTNFSDLLSNRNSRTTISLPFSFAPSSYPRPT